MHILRAPFSPVSFQYLSIGAGGTHSGTAFFLSPLFSQLLVLAKNGAPTFLRMCSFRVVRGGVCPHWGAGAAAQQGDKLTCPWLS